MKFHEFTSDSVLSKLYTSSPFACVLLGFSSSSSFIWARRRKDTTYACATMFSLQNTVGRVSRTTLAAPSSARMLKVPKNQEPWQWWVVNLLHFPIYCNSHLLLGSLEHKLSGTLDKPTTRSSPHMNILWSIVETLSPILKNHYAHIGEDIPSKSEGLGRRYLTGCKTCSRPVQVQESSNPSNSHVQHSR